MRAEVHENLMTEKETSISVVVPILESGVALRALKSDLCAALAGVDYEVIFVDDASREPTRLLLVEIIARWPEARRISCPTRLGQHAATWLGLCAASRSVVVTLDDDGQFAAADIKTLLAALTDDAMIVYGKPRRSAHPIARKTLSVVTRTASRFLPNSLVAKRVRFVSSFRCMHRALIARAVRDGGPPHFVDSLLLRHARTVASIAVDHHPSRVGRSRYHMRDLAQHVARILMQNWQKAGGRG